jgi:hypothetical protein
VADQLEAVGQHAAIALGRVEEPHTTPSQRADGLHYVGTLFRLKPDFVFSESIPLLYGLGSVNPLRVNLCSNTGMPAAVLPFWQSSIAVNASTSTLRPCAFWT